MTFSFPFCTTHQMYTYLYKTLLGCTISGLDSGYPNMHFTLFITISTMLLCTAGFLKNLFKIRLKNKTVGMFNKKYATT